MWRALISIIALILSSQMACANWNSSKEFIIKNDFSGTIYVDGTHYNRTGPHPKAAKLIDGKLVVTLTEKMLDTHTRRTGRFELEKRKINTELAVYQKFQVRYLGGVINDRVLISQIKSFRKKSGGISPMASVLLDRSPNCLTYTEKSFYGLGHHNVDVDEVHGVQEPSSLYVEKVKGVYQHIWSRSRDSNQAFPFLTDGEWHTVEMDAYPHSKNGYCTIKIDGKVWQKITNGPTKSYFSGSHSDYAARIGIYRDAVNHSHTVAFDDWVVEAYDPKNGPKLQ